MHLNNYKWLSGNFPNNSAWQIWRSPGKITVILGLFDSIDRRFLASLRYPAAPLLSADLKFLQSSPILQTQFHPQIKLLANFISLRALFPTTDFKLFVIFHVFAACSLVASLISRFCYLWRFVMLINCGGNAPVTFFRQHSNIISIKIALAL